MIKNHTWMPDVALIHGRIDPRLILAVKPEKSFILSNVDVFQMGIFGCHTDSFYAQYASRYAHLSHNNGPIRTLLNKI